jgi:serine/threonine protein phosphatase PrpC
MVEFDELLQQHQAGKGENTEKNLTRFVYNNLGKAAFHVHKHLEEFAKQEALQLKDLSTTLIFTLFKKYEPGYALLSFGVGDCPMAVLNKDISEVILLNWIDVGEFGGGTRFITMPEIFKSDKFSTRLGFKLVHDFSYLVLMSDGIYDPKFVVEANLPNIKKWKEFLQDLNGKNEDNIKVGLTTHNSEIVEQFSKWMDFWSAGNHDDRTLAIVF